MKLLLNFDDRHPLATTIAGIGGALWLWFMEHLYFIEGVLRVAGTLLGLGTALLAFLIKLRKWRSMRAPFRRPADVDDDIPF